jgi:SAM-dependent methyltransferase
MCSQAIYDSIGHGYARQRQPDPRIAAILHAALGDARSVLNVGAGAGSYEPTDRHVVAVEPSEVMIAQRPPGAARAVLAGVQSLPFDAKSFDAVMAILTIHHWPDRMKGLAECARVAKDRVVLLTWDTEANAFWLLQDYVPGFAEVDRAVLPKMHEYATAFGPGARVEISAVPVPRDCVDGFFGAYWARPAAYLDPKVQAGISLFARMSEQDRAGLERLRADLDSGAWTARHGHLLEKDALDVGYRLVIAHLPRNAGQPFCATSR